MAHLYYIIGASGVGKDSLMNYARERINGGAAILFAHRYITRPAKEGNENHVYISPEEFTSRKEGGLFALDWESHGQYYGIGMEIEVSGWKAGAEKITLTSKKGCSEAGKYCPLKRKP